MKNIFTIAAKKNLLRSALLLCCIISTSAFAQNPNKCDASICKTAGTCEATICTLNSNHDSLVEMLYSYFITGLQKDAEKSSSSDKPTQMDSFDHYKIINDIDIVASDKSLADSMNIISSNLVAYYLAGMDIKQNEMSALEIIPAEDTSGRTPTTTSYDKALNSTNVNYDTAVMNMDTLLGPTQYRNKQQYDAQKLLRYLENLSPIPDIIRISPSFTIPYKNPQTGKSPMTIRLTPSVDDAGAVRTVKQKLDELQGMLAGEPKYTQYKVAYRSAIAARTMLINNLLRFYQERVAPTPASSLMSPFSESTTSQRPKKSVAATDYESATWRLQKTYIDEIKQATPATLSRESLLLLAEIHYDLYKIQRQNEQLIALQSLSNLQVNQLSTMMGESTTKEIAKMIYCWYDKDIHKGKNEAKECLPQETKAPGPGGIPEIPTPQV